MGLSPCEQVEGTAHPFPTIITAARGKEQRRARQTAAARSFVQSRSRAPASEQQEPERSGRISAILPGDEHQQQRQQEHKIEPARGNSSRHGRRDRCNDRAKGPDERRRVLAGRHQHAGGEIAGRECCRSRIGWRPRASARDMSEINLVHAAAEDCGVSEKKPEGRRQYRNAGDRDDAAVPVSSELARMRLNPR